MWNAVTHRVKTLNNVTWFNWSELILRMKLTNDNTKPIYQNKMDKENSQNVAFMK